MLDAGYGTRTHSTRVTAERGVSVRAQRSSILCILCPSSHYACTSPHHPYNIHRASPPRPHSPCLNEASSIPRLPPHIVPSTDLRAAWPTRALWLVFCCSCARRPMDKADTAAVGHRQWVTLLATLLVAVSPLATCQRSPPFTWRESPSSPGLWLGISRNALPYTTVVEEASSAARGLAVTITAKPSSPDDVLLQARMASACVWHPRECLSARAVCVRLACPTAQQLGVAELPPTGYGVPNGSVPPPRSSPCLCMPRLQARAHDGREGGQGWSLGKEIRKCNGVPSDGHCAHGVHRSELSHKTAITQ